MALAGRRTTDHGYFVDLSDLVPELSRVGRLIPFPGDGSDPRGPSVTELAPLAGRVLDGAILYVGDPSGAIVRREVVLSLEGRGLVRLKGDALVPASAPGAVPRPILLAPGRRATYVLLADLGLEPI